MQKRKEEGFSSLKIQKTAEGEKAPRRCWLRFDPANNRDDDGAFRLSCLSRRKRFLVPLSAMKGVIPYQKNVFFIFLSLDFSFT
jgi:hypothetical protein